MNKYTKEMHSGPRNQGGAHGEGCGGGVSQRAGQKWKSGRYSRVGWGEAVGTKAWRWEMRSVFGKADGMAGPTGVMLNYQSIKIFGNTRVTDYTLWLHMDVWSPAHPDRGQATVSPAFHVGTGGTTWTSILLGSLLP